MEDAFDACWSCGTSIEGVSDPAFQREPDDPSIRDESASIAVAGVAPPLPAAAGAGMNRGEIAILICKTLALLLFAMAAFFSVNALVVVVFLLITAPMRDFFQWQELSISLVLLVPAVTALIVGMVYWKYSTAMARGMVANADVPVTQFSLNVKDVMAVAFSTAGVFILVSGVREAVTIAVILYEYDVVAEEFWLSSQTWSAIVQLSLGLWLMIGSRGIVNLIHWLRTVRWPVDDSVPTNEVASGDGQVRSGGAQ